MAGDCSWLSVLAVLAESRTNHVGTDKGGDTASEVDDGRASKVRIHRVTNRHLSNKATAPRPVHNDRVNDGGHDGGKYEIGGEFGAFCQGARSDRHRSCGKDNLEEEVGSRGEAGLKIEENGGVGRVLEEQVAPATQPVTAA